MLKMARAIIVFKAHCLSKINKTGPLVMRVLYQETITSRNSKWKRAEEEGMVYHVTHLIVCSASKDCHWAAGLTTASMLPLVFGRSSFCGVYGIEF